MGYRSDVVIALSKHAYMENVVLQSNLPKVLKDNLPEYKKYFGYYWFIYGFKWYEEYPEVEEVMDFLRNISEDDFAFARLGEEYGDVEFEGDTGLFEIYVNHELCTP